MCKGAPYAVGLLLLITVLSFSTSCVCALGERLAVGDMATDTHSYELGDVRSLDLEVGVNIGTLSIKGGAENLVDCEFRYNVPKWKPEIDYRESGGRATLSIKQPDLGSKSIPNKAKSHWDLVVNGDVELTLLLDVGIGETVLALGEVSVTSIDINQGIGELTLDLDGQRTSDLSVDIDGGIGRATVILPRDVGVRLEADAGIGAISTLGLSRRGGALVNDAYGETDATIELNIDAGIGSIAVQIGGEATAQI